MMINLELVVSDKFKIWVEFLPDQWPYEFQFEVGDDVRLTRTITNSTSYTLVDHLV